MKKKTNLVRETMVHIEREELLALIFGEDFDPNLKNEIHISGPQGAGRLQPDFRMVFVQYDRREPEDDGVPAREMSSEELFNGKEAL